MTVTPSDTEEKRTDGGNGSGGGRRTRAVLIVAAVAAAFHLYGAGISPFTALVQRPVHLALMGTLASLGVGVRALPRSRAGWGFNVAPGGPPGCRAFYPVSRNVTFNESADALRDGALDAAIISVGYPAAS